MSLEMKLNVPKLLKRNTLKIRYKASESVNKVGEVTDKLIKKGIVNKSVIECPIEAITIPGVTLYTNKE